MSYRQPQDEATSPSLRVRVHDDAAEALTAANRFLATRPVEHNVLLTILHDRITDPRPGRYWTVSDGHEVRAFALHSPLNFFAAVAPAGRSALDTLVEAMAQDTPDLPGVIAEATIAARFAGRWAERVGVPATPVEGQRLYRLGELVPPRGVPGRLRHAEAEDRDGLVDWALAFQEDVGGPGIDPAVLDRRIAQRRVFVWDDQGPVSVAFATTPVVGVSRIGFVYTPPERRGRGYAATCVAGMSAHVQSTEAATCILYTQLQNPTSNRIYRRIGYEAVAEGLVYRFGTAQSDR